MYTIGVHSVRHHADCSDLRRLATVFSKDRWGFTNFATLRTSILGACPRYPIGHRSRLALPGRQVSDLAGEDSIALRHRLIRLRRIGLNVAASQRLNILPSGQRWVLYACAGEDDFLFEFQSFIRPEPLVLSPNSFGIQQTHLALSRFGQTGFAFSV